MRRLALAILIFAAGCGGTDPASLISDDLDRVQADLIETIWPDGYPTDTPTIIELPAMPYDLEAVTAEVERVELASVETFGFTSTTYVLHPANPEGFVIVHGGHQDPDQMGVLCCGLAETVDMFLEDGWTVAVMQMPLFGWNRDHTGRVGDAVAWIPTDNPDRHDVLFDFLEPHVGAQTFRVFLEPVTQVLNHYGEAVMVGLSGGGWTTHMVAAVDDRIRLSVPVAGALPLYARGGGEDLEQVYPPIFEETASYLEVFLLGASDGREQLQILNEYDDCCFSGTAYETYAPLLEEQPGWSLWVDRTHEKHQISSAARDVIRRVVSTR